MIKSKFAMIAMAIAASIALTACGDRVDIPPAHVGKILTKDGFQEKVILPSKIRLDACMIYCDSLVLVEASDYAVAETMNIYMPKDKLNLEVDIRGVYQINTKNPAALKAVFDRIPAEPQNNGIALIPAKKIYDTYVVQIIRDHTRSFLTKYTILEVQENREALNAQLIDLIREKTSNLPIQPIQFGMADTQPPKVIVDAQILAKQREIDIQREQANKQVALTKASAELEIAEKDRAVKLLKARTAKEENEILAASVTDKFLQMRYLDVMESMSNSENKVFIPFDALSTPGASMKMFNN